MSFYNKTTATNFNNLRSVYMVIFFSPTNIAKIAL